MKIAILRERAADEDRVAATPETVGKLTGLGASVTIEKDAGKGSRISDADYKAAGASIAASAAAAVKGADIVLTVRRPEASALAGVVKGALLIGGLDPYGNEAAVAALAKAGVSAFAMEFMPRITRAQVMDILSSQANLAGYQAVIEAAHVFDRAMPMMMTAAGTVRPAKAFVMGAGVAGLQAIATAKRLGCVVSATDVRAAAGEQVESLGAKFIMTDALKDASGTGGYARELTKDEQAAQAELVTGHISKQDIVIATALIPGRPAPKLISKAMVDLMAPGSVIVDLAAERGGNCEMTKPGATIVHNGVTIIGITNVAGLIATTASQLFARNLLAFLETLIDKTAKKLAIDWDDELVKATLLTRNGAVVHASFVGAGEASAGKPATKKPAAKAAAKPAATKSAAAKPATRKAPAKKPAGGESVSAAAKQTTIAEAAPATRAPKSIPAATKPKTVRAAKASTPAKSGAAVTRRAKTAVVKKPAAAKKPAARKPAAKKDGAA